MKLNDVMLLLMQRLRNTFEVVGLEYTGNFVIDDNGVLYGGSLPHRGWVAVTGSFLNDGVYFFDGMHLLPSPEDKYQSPETTRQCSDSGTVFATGEKSSSQLMQEDFSGIIYQLKPPAGLVTLCRDIKAFFESPAGIATGATSMSESNVGRHKWSITFARDENGTPKGWYAAFAPRINKSWRRMFESKCMVALNGGG